MRLGTSYKQNTISEKFDVIVIGSGIGGLVSAALLAKHAGKKVLVLERHYTAGGFTHTFTRKGFEWDVGVHYIGEVTHPKAILGKVFDDISDGQIEWEDMGEVYDTIVIGGDRYDFVKGRDNFKRKLGTYFPDETEAISAYVDLVKATVVKSQKYFMEKALPPLVGGLASRFLREPTLRESRKTTGEVLSSLTSNLRLRSVLAGQYGDYGLPPAQSSFLMHALVVNHYFEGGAYPVGGSGAIPAAIISVIEKHGGKVYTNAEVNRIVVRGKRAVGVELSDGTQIDAPIVISDAGAALTYGRLLPTKVANSTGILKRLAPIGASLAHVSLYLGLNKSAEELGLSKPNLWVYPDGNHDGNVTQHLSNPLAPLPVAYISFPSAKDSSFAKRFPNKATIEVVSASSYHWFEEWEHTKWHKRGAAYEARKQEITDSLLKVLYKECPQVEEHIVHCELSTPLSTKKFAGHPSGEIYGLTHTPARFEERWLRPHTPIRGLYLTGADICTAGIGGALMGGVLTVSAILRKNMQSTISAGAKAIRAEKAASRKGASAAM